VRPSPFARVGDGVRARVAAGEVVEAVGSSSLSRRGAAISGSPSIGHAADGSRSVDSSRGRKSSRSSSRAFRGDGGRVSLARFSSKARHGIRAIRAIPR
jgi:hypothetical protein